MNIGTRTLTDEQNIIRRYFVAFFEDDAMRDKYDRKIHDMMDAAATRLIVDMADLLDYSGAESQGQLGRGVIRQPGLYVPLCELALVDLIQARQPDYLKVDYHTKTLHVGFEGPVGEVLGPRDVYARHLNTMIAVEGIITRQSPLRPRILETVHYCAATNKFSRKEYRDQLTPMLDTQHLPTVNVLPRTDMEGNPLRVEFGLSSFVDSQCAMLQEAPENAPTGQLPRNIEIRLDDDLVDSAKPGDRVTVVGMYAAYTSGENNKGFQTIVLANHIYHQALAVKVPRLLDRHQDELRRFARAESARLGPTAVLDILARSIAPTIYGLSNEKKAVLLMMVGGVERKAHNTHVRGNINVLLVGEPSTAKSQLLRYVLNVVPLALSTTGRGSSGVGLTAAVAVDSYTGERSLSAGAMVLADRGILCIDEFDKMSPQDRIAMHEAMEQQTVTIAKAGIHASLNARCSVLAAANPVYGFYSVKHKLAYNVGLPESLLSRFDLTFIVLDQHASDHNRRVGAHILRNHVSAAPAAMNAAPTRTVVGRSHLGSNESDENDDSGVIGSDGTCGTVNAEGKPAVPIGFLRRYLRLTQSVSPMLTDTAQRMIVDNYSQLRQEQVANSGLGKDGFLITTRALESIIRLATAHAKLRLSPAIAPEDVEVAMQLIRASVHAGTHAGETRDAERTVGTKTDRAEEAAAAGLTVPIFAPAGPTPRGETADGAPAPLAAVGRPVGAPTFPPELRQRAKDALARFRAAARTEVHLEEIATRLGGGVDLVQLRAAVEALARDEDFTFESTEADDVVYFV
jgi:DNA replication licensing factor MCM3